MSPTLLLLLAYLAASLSCMGAVVSWLIQQRGGDASLKADVNELTLLVERLAKTERRERMSRVRRSRDAPEQIEVPPGAEAIPLEGTQETVTNAKDELRRRVLAARGIGR